MNPSERVKISNTEISGEYKAVLIRFEEKDYFILKEASKNLHAYILRDFLLENNIGYKTRKNRLSPSFEVDIPELEGEKYKVIGMGKVEIFHDTKKANFYGKSLDYGLPFSDESISSIKNLMKDWEISNNPGFFE